MNRSVTASAIALAVVFLAAPLASAEWKAYGTYEPDSRLDSTSFLHTLKPGEYPAGKPKVYFNAYPMHDALVGGGIANPNNAVTRSQVGGGAGYQMGALLGFWTDCNGDGYVGDLETAVREYRSELLTPAELAACPAENKFDVKVVGGRVIGTLIIEFITIGREGLGVQDPKTVVDPAAMIWGDEGFYFPEPGSDEFRPVGPQPRACGAGGRGGPRGSYDTVGGVLNNMECSTGRAGIPIWNAVVPTVLGDSYRFQDEENYDQPGHPVGDRDTFGRDDSRSNSYATFADCSQGPLVDLGTVQGPERRGHGPRPPKVPTTNTNGNVAGTYNETWESTLQNCRTQAQDDTDTDYDREFYGLFEGASGSTGAVGVRGKAVSDFNFQYKEMSRNAVPCGTPTGSQDCGISALNGWLGSSTVGQNSFWAADEPIGSQVTFPVRDAANAKLTNATFYTFYANVGTVSTTKGALPGGEATYGSNFCGSGGYEQTGPTQYHHGWNCNKNEWNLGGDGTITFPQSYPGLTYRLRDVDCFDGTVVKDTPVTVSAQKLSDVPCWDDNIPL